MHFSRNAFMSFSHTTPFKVTAPPSQRLKPYAASHKTTRALWLKSRLGHCPSSSAQDAWFTCLRLPHRPGKGQKFLKNKLLCSSIISKTHTTATGYVPEWAETGVTLPVVTVPAELLLEKILPCKTASSFASAPYSGHGELLQAERTLARKIPKLFVSFKKKYN